MLLIDKINILEFEKDEFIDNNVKKPEKNTEQGALILCF